MMIQRQTCREAIAGRGKANAASEGNCPNYYLNNKCYTTTLKDTRQSSTSKLVTEQVGEKQLKPEGKWT